MLWAYNLRVPGSCPPLCHSLDLSRDGVEKWFRALDLKSGGPRFNIFLYSVTQLDLFLGSPKFNSSTAPCRWPM